MAPAGGFLQQVMNHASENHRLTAGVLVRDRALNA